jgi:signal transduction histidine kinase
MRLFQNIAFKLGTIIFIVILVVLLPFGLVIDRVISHFYIDYASKGMVAQGDQYAELLAQVPSEKTVEIILALANMNQFGVILLDQENKVVINSPLLPQHVVETVSSRYAANAIVASSQRRQVMTIGKERYVVSFTPVVRRSQPAGTLVLVSSGKELNKAIKSIRATMLLALLGALSLAAGFIMILSRRMSYQLREMERVSRKLAAGELEHRIRVKGDDEVAHLQRSINDLADHLDRYRQGREAFLSDVAHELRTPLTYIQGYIQALRKEMYKSDEERREWFGIVEEETERLQTLVRHLLLSAQIQEEKTGNTAADRVRPGALLEEVINKVKLRADSRQVTIVIDDPLDGSFTLLVNRQKMMQALFNLIDNALRHTPAGGWIRLSCRKQAPFVLFEVTDSGEGIPEEKLPMIWERFYRADEGRTREQGGTGLGLAIVRQIVAEHNGQIDVKSQPGKGTTFTLRIPYEFTE